MASITSNFLSTDVSLQELLGAGMRFDYDKVGAEILLVANYYEIKISHGIYRYEVIRKDLVKNRLLDRDIYRSQFWEAVNNDLNSFGKLENLIYNYGPLVTCYF
ncbi:unnamed protein product [Cercopithifilaria johnstoni]|uniref:Uncharacterized protein n=1 Tax=Cercopithifilaria johnstoni TaxID=2874296 RepID=A0A8J2PPJ1_9BILA|nr:unnamed protein product [Cercopithifilaria johnstoni]